MSRNRRIVAFQFQVPKFAKKWSSVTRNGGQWCVPEFARGRKHSKVEKAVGLGHFGSGQLTEMLGDH